MLDPKVGKKDFKAQQLEQQKRAQEAQLKQFEAKDNQIDVSFETKKEQDNAKKESMSSQIESAEQNIDNLNNNVTAANTKVQTATTNVQTATAAVESAGAALASAQEALASAQAASSSSAGEGTQEGEGAQSVDNSGAIAAAEAALASAQAAYDQAVAQQQQAEQELSTAQSEYEAANQELATAQSELSALNQDKSELETSTQEAQAKLEAEQQANQAKIDEAQSKISELDNQIAEQEQKEETSNKDEATDDEIKQHIYASKEEIEAKYEDWADEQLRANGLKTTNIHEGETNFAEYGAALSEEMQQMILDSFDSPEDYELQQKIAGLFQNTNVVQTNDFIAACRSMGLEVSLESIESSYIRDYKIGVENGGGSLSSAGLSVLTIRDASTGAEIKIVDANGNGAIEVEELFMNELLTGIATEIDPSNFGKASYVHVSGAGSGSAANLNDKSIADDEKEKTKDDFYKDKLIEKLTEKYVDEGINQMQAHVQATQDVENMTDAELKSAIKDLD